MASDNKIFKPKISEIGPINLIFLKIYGVFSLTCYTLITTLKLRLKLKCQQYANKLYIRINRYILFIALRFIHISSS